MIPTPELEQVYDALAEGIDRATPAGAELFLAKVVLLLANEIGEAATVRRCIDAALAEP